MVWVNLRKWIWNLLTKYESQNRAVIIGLVRDMPQRSIFFQKDEVRTFGNALNRRIQNTSSAKKYTHALLGIFFCNYVVRNPSNPKSWPKIIETNPNLCHHN